MNNSEASIVLTDEFSECVYGWVGEEINAYVRTWIKIILLTKELYGSSELMVWKIINFKSYRLHPEIINYTQHANNIQNKVFGEKF